MDTLDEILDIENKLERIIDGEIEIFIENAGNDNRRFMIDLINDQLDMGIDGDGTQIKPPYSASTVVIKKKKAQIFDRVTLKDKGDWRGEIQATSNGSEFVFTSLDSKNAALEKKYGDQISSPNPDSVEKISIQILPSITEQTRKFLQI